MAKDIAKCRIGKRPNTCRKSGTLKNTNDAVSEPALYYTNKHIKQHDTTNHVEKT